MESSPISAPSAHKHSAATDRPDTLRNPSLVTLLSPQPTSRTAQWLAVVRQVMESSPVSAPLNPIAVSKTKREHAEEQIQMELSDEYIVSVLRRGNDCEVATSAYLQLASLSPAFVAETKEKYIDLLRRLIRPACTYTEHHKRTILLCEDIKQAVGALSTLDSCANALHSPPVELVRHLNGLDDDDATDDSYVDDDDEDDEENGDEEEEDCSISNDSNSEGSSESEIDGALIEGEEESDALNNSRASMSSGNDAFDEARANSLRFGEEIVPWDTFHSPTLPAEFVSLFRYLICEEDSIIPCLEETLVSPTALQLLYEYVNDQVALSFENPSCSVLRLFGVNLQLVHQLYPPTPTSTTSSPVSAGSADRECAIASGSSINELLATEQTQSSALLVCLQNVYRQLVRDALDLHAGPSSTTVANSAGSATIANSSSATRNEDVLVKLLLNRCVDYERTIERLEEERNSAIQRADGLQQQLSDVHRFAVQLAAHTEVNAANVASESDAGATKDASRLTFESRGKLVEQKETRGQLTHSEGATSFASGVSAPLSIASSLPDSHEMSLKRGRHAGDDSQWHNRLTDHVVPHSDYKRGRAAE